MCPGINLTNRVQPPSKEELTRHKEKLKALIGGVDDLTLLQIEDDGSGFGDPGDGVRVPGRIPANVKPLMSEAPAGLTRP